MSRHSKLTQNYDIVFQSTVSAANNAIMEYMKIQMKIASAPFYVSTKGEIVLPSQEYMNTLKKKEEKALDDFSRIMKDISFMKDHESDIREGRCFV